MKSKKILTRTTTETFQDNGMVIVEVNEQYIYNTEEEAKDHAEKMTADGWKDSGQSLANLGGHYTPYRHYFKTELREGIEDV